MLATINHHRLIHFGTSDPLEPNRHRLIRYGPKWLRPSWKTDDKICNGCDYFINRKDQIKDQKTDTVDGRSFSSISKDTWICFLECSFKTMKQSTGTDGRNPSAVSHRLLPADTTAWIRSIRQVTLTIIYHADTMKTRFIQRRRYPLDRDLYSFAIKTIPLFGREFSFHPIPKATYSAHYFARDFCFLRE